VGRIPRSALQLLVGTLLSSFGTFWAVEGLGVAWPGGDAAILALVGWYVVAAAGTVAATVAAALVVTWLLHTAGVAAWRLPPLAAVAAVGASLRRVSRSAGGPPRTAPVTDSLDRSAAIRTGHR
jgi:uncharacterized membrane protein